MANLTLIFALIILAAFSITQRKKQAKELIKHITDQDDNIQIKRAS